MSQHAPDIHTLVQAANLFPLLIESDQISAARARMFGPLNGAVTAKALYSFATPSRFKQSSFPVLQISATSPGRKAAVRLAQDTTLAFSHWLIANQIASSVPPNERILVQELQAPRGAIATGGTKKSLPVAVGVAVLALFLGLVLLLDRPAAPLAGEGSSAEERGHDEHEPRAAAIA